MTTTEFIDGTAGRIAIHRFDTADQAQPMLLVCHATGFLGMVYRALAHELRDDFTVVALDFRGHGDSDTPDDLADFAWPNMSSDLLAVVDHLAVDELHGFGHSMGGAALLAAERHRPNTFASLFAFEPIVPPGPFGDGESPLTKAARARLRTFPGYPEALQRYASKPPLGLFRADVLSDYVNHGFADVEDGVTLKCTPENEAATFGHAGVIKLADMAEVAARVVIGQSSDGGLPAQLAPAIVDALPAGELRHFSTITHFGPLQDPVVVANALREQLDG